MCNARYTHGDLRVIAQTNHSWKKENALNAHETFKSSRKLARVVSVKFKCSFFTNIIFGRMRSVLSLFSIVADASTKLHRAKKKLFQCSGLMNLNRVGKRSFCEWKNVLHSKSKLHSQLEIGKTFLLHNLIYFESDQRKKEEKRFVGVKSVLKLSKNSSHFSSKQEK